MPLHGDKFGAAKVTSEIAILTPSTELLIGVGSVIDIQLCSPAARTRLVRNVLQESYSPKAFSPQNLIEESVRWILSDM